GEREASIGRDSSNDLWIADRVLSRRHCLLTPQDGKILIRDLGSKNGTFVNGVPVTEQLLHHGDHITVGQSVLVFQEQQGEIKHPDNPVEFSETSEMDFSALVLRPEDALYLVGDKLTASLPQTPRMAKDLNALLKIATRIGGIRDRDSLQWQLLGFVFDVVPAERAAVLFFDGGDEFSSAAGWDRARGPGYTVRVR